VLERFEVIIMPMGRYGAPQAERYPRPSPLPAERLSWIMENELEGYTSDLFSDEQVQHDLAAPDNAFLADARLLSMPP
jgi:hypothetical protein